MEVKLRELGKRITMARKKYEDELEEVGKRWENAIGALQDGVGDVGGGGMHRRGDKLHENV